MFYLVGSIVLTSYLTLAFKMLEKFHINPFQAIVFNYCTCVVTGSIVNNEFPVHASTIHEDWFGWALLMGCMLVSIFNLLGVTTQKAGVAVASVANKLSLIIPFIFSVYLYNEHITSLKIVGIITALIAVILTCWPSGSFYNKNNPGSSTALLLVILPALLFFSSGLLDTTIKYVEQSLLNEENKNAYLITAFAVAAAIGLILLIFFVIAKRQQFSYKSIVAGICIGVPNYFSLWCLVKVLKRNSGNSSAIIPINNMGIV
ncbi:MAG: EamA family transporter, partial [Bacteroidetes bacterium]|nr:EamA family transporter [Bacteroidota bacterium]